MFNYDEFILHDESDDSYTVVCPDRKEFRFIKNGDIYTPTVNCNYHKLENGTEGTFVLTLKDGWKHYYDNYGRLIKIRNRTGQCIQYERGSTFTSPISRIIGPSGRSLTFSQENVIDDNNKDIVITDWIGRKWRYVIKDGYINQIGVSIKIK